MLRTGMGEGLFLSFPMVIFRSMSSGKMPSLLGLESELVRIKGWL
jgi:hypothetical protein